MSADPYLARLDAIDAKLAQLLPNAAQTWGTDYNNADFTKVRPTQAEFDARLTLPKAKSIYDLAECVALARVGLMPNGEPSVATYTLLMEDYDKIDRLRSGADHDFVDAAKPYPELQPASWGTQQVAALIGPSRSPGYDWREGGLSHSYYAGNLNSMSIEGFFAAWFLQTGLPSGF